MKERWGQTPLNFLTICMISTGVQIENYLFAKVQNDDINRIMNIEKLVRSDYWDQFGEKLEIDAPSFFETRNCLAVESDHWDKYSNIYGKKCVWKDDPELKVHIQMQKNNDFYLYWDNISIHISPSELEGEICCQDNSRNNKIVNVQSCIYSDSNYYFYSVY